MTDLDELYDTRRGIDDVDAIIEGWYGEAAEFRARWPHSSLDVAYGPRPRNDVDLFWPADGAADRAASVPMVVFIHGGYWRRFDRQVFSHLAEGLVRKNVAVAMPSYTLAPEATVAEIADELRGCLRFLHSVYGRQVSVVGHSAGAHLAASLFATDWSAVDGGLPADLVRSGLGLSGIYDLAPLLSTEINGTLALDPDTARAASPLYALPPALRRFDAWVGRRESAAFHEQSRDFVTRWSMTGTRASLHTVPNAHHFDIVRPLANPRSRMVKHVLNLIAHPEGEQRDETEQEPERAPVEA